MYYKRVYVSKITILQKLALPCTFADCPNVCNYNRSAGPYVDLLEETSIGIRRFGRKTSGPCANDRQRRRIPVQSYIILQYFLAKTYLVKLHDLFSIVLVPQSHHVTHCDVSVVYEDNDTIHLYVLVPVCPVTDHRNCPEYIFNSPVLLDLIEVKSRFDKKIKHAKLQVCSIN